MAFFGDLGNNIKSMGSSISNSAKDMTQKAQLNSEISSIKKDITGFYTKLGEATYKNLTASEEEKTDVQPIIDNINGAFIAIKENEEKIARIEAEAEARKAEEEARKRREAEERERAAAASSGAVCHVCGAAILPDSRFCVQCGSPVIRQEEAPAPEQAAEKCCPSCGAHCEPDARFCTECGTKLQ